MNDQQTQREIRHLATLSPAHCFPAFQTDAGCLLWGGMPLTRLADRVGRTPFYAYDRKRLDDRVAQLRAVLPGSVKLHYALKANPMPALVCHMATLVDGFDVASGAELQVALDANMDATEISFAGPAKRREELAQAVAAGVLLNVESFREARLLAELSADAGLPARVAVRINPDFDLKSSGMRMGGGPKQFGVDAEQVPELLQEIGRLGLAFEGFHLYAGSQNLKAEAICEAQEKTVDLGLRLMASAPATPTVFNIGGGFGIPYFPGEKPLDLVPVGQNLHRLVRLAHEVAPSMRLVLELGRFLVGEAGIYVCRVLDRKISRGQVFLITDGGMHHHLAASGNFGQVIRKNYPAVIGNRMISDRREFASVVGPLCTPLDVLADRVELAEAQVGDLVVVFQSGAYGLTASPTAFLSHPAPAEVLL
ncbi:MAG: pyridoxal-dependent decarboxylase, exosortase A system-associated [Betaproteobacteria bacterium]|nr:pyridoxal-dependent decarboxylase, exosortase A system-associated [Betaproteobacteria bacterium]